MRIGETLGLIFLIQESIMILVDSTEKLNIRAINYLLEKFLVIIYTKW